MKNFVKIERRPPPIFVSAVTLSEVRPQKPSEVASTRKSPPTKKPSEVASARKPTPTKKTERSRLRPVSKKTYY